MGSESQTGDDKLLSYGDILLRRSDIDLLKGPCWLNDQVHYLLQPAQLWPKWVHSFDNLLVLLLLLKKLVHG